MPPVLILGCGYTGRRVARSLLEKGASVTVTTRHPEALATLASDGARILRLDLPAGEAALDALRETHPSTAVLHSIPLVSENSALSDPTPPLLEALRGHHARMVYLSTTGVYGGVRDVDERTTPAPRTGRERLRVDAERAIAAEPRPALILRPAAIYGPGRGVQVALPAGEYRLLGRGDNFVSRIHVDDLAALAEAALFSEIAGAYPVADEEPCTSREIAEFCARLLGIAMPPEADEGDLGETRRADRRVNGSAIRRALGVELRYPSYRVGIPASL